MPQNDISEGREVMTVESGTLAILNKSEIDQQIATAHKYPRSLVAFRKEMLQMVTLTEKIAGECIYALPRDGKVIEGPSARFAEVAASAWGNARAGARVVNEGNDFVTAQGVFHDLERNVAITYEVQRRITDKNGKKYKPDMIGVTANAACSIALRNAILKGIPKAFWSEMYESARRASVGDIKSIANKRADAVKAFVVYGIDQAQILARLGRTGVQDITVDDLVTLNGFLTAIKDGDGSAESIFAVEAQGSGSDAVSALNAGIKGGDKKSAAETKKDGGTGPTFAAIAERIKAASSNDDLDLVADLARGLTDPAQVAEADVEIRAKRKTLEGAEAQTRA
jgi:hypothetical protein